MKRGLCILSVMLLQSSFTTSASAEICWIERLSQDQDGLHLYFTGRRVVRLIHKDDKPQHYEVSDPLYRSQEGQIGQILFVQKGEGLQLLTYDKFFSQNSPHDSCTFEVTVQDGQVGVLALASFHDPMLEKGSTISKFIPATSAPLR